MNTIQAIDRDKDGHLDRIDVQFNQAMESSPPVAANGSGPGFTVVGYTITALTWNGSPAITLGLDIAELPDYDTGVTPFVTYTPGAGSSDLKTALGVTLDAWDASSVDAAWPLFIGVTAKDYGDVNLFTNPGDEAFLRFSEPISVVGATPADRWASLERAVTFTVLSGGSGCLDGTGVITGRNFPRPQTATDDSILSPASGERSATIHVRFLPTNEASTSDHRMTGIPVGCKLGIHDQHNASILDAAGNRAVPLTTTAAKHLVYPADATLLSATTADGVGGAPDGLVDAVRLTFDLQLDGDTLASHISEVGVTLDGVGAGVSSFTIHPSAVTVDLVLGSQVWGGGQTPRVSYTRHASCADTPSGTTGTGIKAKIHPLAPTHRACVASFDTVTTDGVAPVIASARTIDADADGLVDGAIATLTEPVTGTVAGWTIGGAPATSFAAAGNEVTLGFDEGTIGTGDSPAVAYATPETDATTDANGIGVRPGSVNAADGAAPRLDTVTVRDADGDGNIETGDFRFTEAVTTSDAGAFSLGGIAASQILSATGNTVSVSVDGLTGSAAQIAGFDAANGAVTDAAGLAAPSRSIVAGSVVDLALPVGTIEISPNAPVGPGTTTIRGRFSEPMDATAPVVTFAGRAVAGAWTADAAVWEGSIEIAPEDCSVATGCEVSALFDGAKDQRLNAQAAQISRVTEIDTVAPAVPGSLTFAVTPDAPAGFVNASTTDLTIGLVTAGDAAGGTAEILLDGAPFATAATTPVSGDAVQVTKSFASASDLAAEIAEGAHQAAIRLCDDARNCVSADVASFTADFTPVQASITTDFPAVISGGSSQQVAWDGDELATDLTDVTVASSTDGTTFTTITSAQPADGSTTWTVPSVNVAGAVLRVSSTDAAGNVHRFTTESFTIDSAAPAVSISAPVSSSPFLSRATTVRWTATDVSETTVAIEYSTNNGATWAPIDGGSYSSANDGIESWTVPNVRSFDVRVRVRGTDQVGRSTTVTTGRLVAGVVGFVADRGGSVYGFGASSTSVRETMRSGSDMVRGIAVRRDDRSGYVLARDGRIFPFAETGATLPPSRATTRFRGDLARGIVLVNDTRGYVVDAYGRVYGFGGVARATPSRTWSGQDLARGLVLRADKRGGYVLDAYGRLHPFRIGSYAWPRAIQGRTISSKRAVSVILRPGDRSGYVLENTGRLLRFGGAPSIYNPYVSSRAGARAIVPITSTGGYWVDGRGIMRRYGTAYGAPSKVTLGSGRARGAAG